jgi:putative NADH-flavin reductase
MHITIFGSTGGTGTLLVEQALAAGHEVTAVVRDPARLNVAVPPPAGVPPAGPGPGGPSPAGPSPAGPSPAGLTPGGLTPGGLTPGGSTVGGSTVGGSTVGGSTVGGSTWRPRVVTADIMDPGAITDAVAGADAVLSALGPRSNGPTTVSRDGHRSIIAAMRRAGTRRLLMVSGTVVTDVGESPYLRYLAKPLVRGTFLRHVCADMRAAEAEVHAADLDWTIVRPPSLTDKPARGGYRTAIDRNLPHGFTLSRADLAACMLSLITEPGTFRRHVCAAN